VTYLGNDCKRDLFASVCHFQLVVDSYLTVYVKLSVNTLWLKTERGVVSIPMVAVHIKIYTNYLLGSLVVLPSADGLATATSLSTVVEQFLVAKQILEYVTSELSRISSGYSK